MYEEMKARYVLHVSRKVKELRKRIFLTQVECAKRAGVGLRFFKRA